MTYGLRCISRLVIIFEYGVDIGLLVLGAIHGECMLEVVRILVGWGMDFADYSVVGQYDVLGALRTDELLVPDLNQTD